MHQQKFLNTSVIRMFLSRGTTNHKPIIWMTGVPHDLGNPSIPMIFVA